MLDCQKLGCIRDYVIDKDRIRAEKDPTKNVPYFGSWLYNIYHSEAP